MLTEHLSTCKRYHNEHDSYRVSGRHTDKPSLPMAPKKFLWVNKSARSTILSRAEADETVDIFRHIHEHIQWTKNEQVRRPVETDAPLALSPSTLKIINAAVSSPSSVSDRPQENSRPPKADSLSMAELWSARGLTFTDLLSQGHRCLGREHATTKSPTLHRPVCGKDESVDAFNCTSIPITQTVHQLLIYFESLWYPSSLVRVNPSPNFISPGHQIMQACISDSLQMNCVLATAESRLKNFHTHSLKGGSKQYIERAIRQLSHRLGKEAELEGKHIYAIMRLYVAEAYRGNLSEALLHLNGARAAYSRLAPQTDLNLHYTTTLCGMAEAAFLSKVWDTPAIFPTIADPGAANGCFRDEKLKDYLAGQHENARALFICLDSMTQPVHGIVTLRQVLIDMIDYAIVRRNMTSREYIGQPIPEAVTKWAHLRRSALVFRLMSIDAAKNPLLHIIRVALVTWLDVAVDFSGFERNLELIVMHLRDIIRLIPKAEMTQHADVMAWIFLLGAIVGDRATRLCFVKGLANSDVFDTASDFSVAGWFKFLEDTSIGCLYCQTIQRQSLVELAKELCLYRCQSLVSAD